ncbi:MAG: hypothetical protein II440_02270 [Clostridia bacterium]|nr:hypothetical protein [Clostridia bacterium]
MKKHGKAAAVLLTSLLFSIYTIMVCCAASNTYNIPEADISVELPDNIIVATQGIRENDDLFDKDKGGWDYIQTMSEMRDNGDNLLGKASDNSYKIEVKVSDNSSIKDLNKLSDKKLNAFFDTIRSESDVFEVSEKQINSQKYAGVVRNTKLSETALYSYEYVTVSDSKNITLKITSYNDRLNDSETELLSTIVSSITFSNADKVHTAPRIGGSLIFAFCVLSVGFAVLVICRLHEEFVHRIIEKIKALINRPGSDNKEKQITAENTEDNTAEKTQETHKNMEEHISDNSSETEQQSVEMGASENTKSDNDTELTAESSDVSENSHDESKQADTTEDKESEKSEEQEDREQYSDIDLDEAIANFDDSAEARQRRRKESSNTAKKKKGLFK